jgi:hypothetical protein
MKFVTSFPLSGNGTDFREFGYTGSSDDISGCWIATTICVTGARHNINKSEILQVTIKNLLFSTSPKAKRWYPFTHSWSSALLEKLPTVQLLKNFPAIYCTLRFITAFTRALHWCLS